MGNILTVNGLSVFYDKLQAIKDVSFSLEHGLIVGIVGPNGAGKSTLIKGTLGLERCQAKEIKAFGHKLQKVRNKIAYVPQRNDIDWDFPVLVEDVVMMGRFVHIPWYKRPTKQDKEKVEQALEKVGMLDFRKRQIGELSGGQQQRIFIARALAQEADLFFLDEPFVGIDVTSEEIIMNILRKLRNDGKTVLVVHHDLSKVESYFDKIMLLNKELIAYGDVKDIFKPSLLSEAYKGQITVIKENEQTMVVSG